MDSGVRDLILGQPSRAKLTNASDVIPIPLSSKVAIPTFSSAVEGLIFAVVSYAGLLRHPYGHALELAIPPQPHIVLFA